MLRNLFAVVTAVLALSTTACTQQQVTDAQALQPVAMGALSNATAADKAKIAAVSQAVVTGIAAVKAGAIAAGADSATLAQIGADQQLAQSGKDNIDALAANDAAPPTATNSGNSTAWEQSLLDDAVKVAGIVLPLVL